MMRRVLYACLPLLLFAIYSSAPAAAQDQKDREFQECTDCPLMVGIPAGTFLMGSPADEPGRFDAEGPQHRVAIRAFALGKFDVTTAEFLIFLRETGYQPAPCNKILTLGWQSPGHGHAYARSDAEPPTWPATCVGWKDALSYIGWLNAKAHAAHPALALRDGPYRLPSEAEWEYAAPRWLSHVALVGQRGRHEQCELQWLRQQIGRPCAHRCRQFRAKSVRSLRHAWQCLAVDSRLLAQKLCRSACQWQRLDR
jgi:formylglycine-generating enzyme required for sulfatase activity